MLRLAVDQRKIGAAFLLRIDEDAEEIPLEVSVEDGTFVVQAEENGVYLAVAFELPDGCERTFEGSIDATANDDVQRLEGVTRLQGDLSLGGTVSNIEALRCLTWITGNLTVSATELKELELAALVRVDGHVTVTDDNLEKIGLRRIRFLGSHSDGSLAFDELPELVQLDLGNVLETPGQVRLTNLGATAEESLELDLGSLKRVGDGLYIDSATNLKTLRGLRSLERVGGELVVAGNTDLETIDALSSLLSIDGRLSLTDNPVLTSADLGALESVFGSVSLADNPMLASADLGALKWTTGFTNNSLVFDNLPELVLLELGSVLEADTLQLTNVGASAKASLQLNLNSLERLSGALIIQSATNLEKLDGVQSLYEVGDELRITENAALETIELSSLHSPRLGLWLTDNPVLSSAHFGVTYAVVSLVFDNLPTLVQLDLGNMESASAVQLTNIGAGADASLELDLGSLIAISGDLNLTGVANLVDMGAFEALEDVRGSLTVGDNPQLASLSGFGKLVVVEGDLAITSNSALPTCEAFELRNRLQDEGFDGTATISGNLPGDCD